MAPVWNPVEFAGDDADGAEEPMGSKDKAWVDVPGDDRRWLLKFARTDERDGTVSGEDWAEWVVSQLAFLLGVPAARVRPASVDGRCAIVSRSVLHDDHDALDHGNSLLSGRFSEYGPSVRGENPGYTVCAVRQALSDVAPPIEALWPAQFSGYDVWAGYLVMDAWVSGRDRHDENWAAVEREGARRLAPSFDHGNALGFQLRDERRTRMLGDEAQFSRWTAKGTSPYFAGLPHLVDLAHAALRIASPASAEYWPARLDAVDDDDVASVVSAVPEHRLSAVGRTFVLQLLAQNRRRLLDDHTGL